MKTILKVFLGLFLSINCEAHVLRLIPVPDSDNLLKISNQAMILHEKNSEMTMVKGNILCPEQGSLQEEESLRNYGFRDFKSCQKVQKMVQKASAGCAVVLELDASQKFIDKSYFDCDDI